MNEIYHINCVCLSVRKKKQFILLSFRIISQTFYTFGNLVRGQKIELSTIPAILNVVLSIRGCDVISIKNLLGLSNDN